MQDEGKQLGDCLGNPVQADAERETKVLRGYAWVLRGVRKPAKEGDRGASD